MKNNENEEILEGIVEESTKMVVSDSEKEKNDLMNFNANRKSDIQIFTNITDKKKLFNVENGEIDYKINDLKGTEIVVKEFEVKRIIKDLEEPVINEETGEIKEQDKKMITILIDDKNNTYVTASSMFAFQFLRLVECIGIDAFEECVKIRIIEKSIKDSKNKSLGFKLL